MLLLECAFAPKRVSGGHTYIDDLHDLELIFHIYMYGPVEGRRHDAFILGASELSDKLK